MLKPGMMCITQTGAFPDMALSGTLPNWSHKRAYSAGLTRIGGTAPYVWSIVSGSLPSGLSIDSTTGIISGTPATSGNSTFTVQVEDTHSLIRTRSQTVNFAADVSWANVTTLLPFNGTNGDTTTTDISSIASTMTREGSAVISTAQGKFYGSALHCISPSGSHGFSLPQGSSTDISGSGDFTVEMWLWISVYNTGSNTEFILASQSLIAGGFSWIPTINSSTGVSFYFNTTFPNFGAGAGLGGISTGAWHHFAFVRTAGAIKYYLDGIQTGIGAGESISSTSITTPTDKMYIGLTTNTSSGNPEIFMNEFRITRAARYTSNFTPPTLPFPGG